jgi:hypothetical protein
MSEYCLSSLWLIIGLVLYITSRSTRESSLHYASGSGCIADQSWAVLVQADYINLDVLSILNQCLGSTFIGFFWWQFIQRFASLAYSKELLFWNVGRNNTFWSNIDIRSAKCAPWLAERLTTPLSSNRHTTDQGYLLAKCYRYLKTGRSLRVKLKNTLTSYRKIQLKLKDKSRVCIPKMSLNSNRP